MRYICTGLPASIGGKFLRGIKGQLSDGMWENSSFMEGYWKFFDVFEENGMVMIGISEPPSEWGPHCTRPTPNRFYGKDRKWILKWFAGKGRELAKAEEKSAYKNLGFEMKKGNQAQSIYWGLRYRLTGNDIWICVKMLEGMVKA